MKSNVENDGERGAGQRRIAGTTLILCGIAASLLGWVALGDSVGCGSKNGHEPLVVYCGVDEPYASKVFEDFEKQTGILVAPQYDIESSKSVGLESKLEAEASHPRADVWWSSEPFLSGRAAANGVLDHYVPENAKDIPAKFKDPKGYWTGVAWRVRVLAVGVPPPDFKITSIQDLADPRLKGKVTMSRPTAGATVAHVAALYALWGPEKAQAFFQRLYDNKIALVGGNAEVATQVGNGNFVLGLTDTDDISDALSSGGQLSMVVPDQGPDQPGTLAMPTTVGLVKGSPHSEDAKKLINFLVTRHTEDLLIQLHYARWSVRAPETEIKAMKVDYDKAVQIAPLAQKQATAILDGRKPD